MALINCPECGKEVSNTAVACPNCGHPMTPPAVEERTVVREVPPPVTNNESFPKWMLAPIIVLGAILIFLIIFLFRSQDDDQRNINVDLSKRQTANKESVTGGDLTRDRADSASTVTAPSDVSTQEIPTTSQANVMISENPDTTATASVSLEAKITSTAGGIQPVKNEKFYLLDEDLQTILSDAEIEDKTGQGLINSFGLSVLYPERYREINKKALDEINKHIVYDTLTDSTGKAQIKNVKPDNYYLFGITKTKTGFAVWSAPVTINSGQNVLNLQPARLTEIKE